MRVDRYFQVWLAVALVMLVTGLIGIGLWLGRGNGPQGPQERQDKPSASQGAPWYSYLVCNQGARFALDVLQVDGKRGRIVVSQGCRLVEQEQEVCGR